MDPGVRRDDEKECLATARHSLYGARAFGDFAVTRPIRPASARWAILVLAALALGACGRKGGLDLPPQAAATPMGTGTAASNADNSAAAKGSAMTSSNEPDEVRAARGRKRSFFLDPILD
jgi:predicted small lipoprotein YifL